MLGKRLLVAEHQTILREALAARFGDVGFSAVECATWGELAATLAREDIVLFDPHLARVDAVAAVTHIAEAGGAVVVFENREDPDYAQLLLRAGARGLVLRSARFDELQTALDQVSRGQRYLPDKLRHAIAERLLQGRATRGEDLTPRERRVLRHAALGGSVQDIASVLVVSGSTIKKHLRSAYAKLGVNTRSGAAEEMRRLGLGR